MTKILLVEDDKSLREIYGIRLAAEGYEIVSAGDGEEALAMAVQERPDLVLSDVMMPKISGFDMLDILRSTPETEKIKVIMMTALSSEDQRERGENLGADRYLVKSQVGIEDVINVVHEVLGDAAGGAAKSESQPAGQAAPAEQPAASAPTTTSPAGQATPVEGATGQAASAAGQAAPAAMPTTSAMPNIQPAAAPVMMPETAPNPAETAPTTGQATPVATEATDGSAGAAE